MADPQRPPAVSVLIAAWSAESTLDRAIDSALRQTVPVEVIVVDDASPDGSAALARARAAADDRIIALYNARNQGPSAARNRALAVARAPWVTVLDADDFFCSESRLELLIEIASAEEADFVGDDLWKVDETDPYGRKTAMISSGTIGRVQIDAATFIAANLSESHGGRREFGFLKPLMSRAFLTAHGLSYDPEIRLGEDYVLYTRALLAGARFILTDAAGYAAVVRPTSLSAQHPTVSHERLVAVDRALLARPDLDAATLRALKAHLLEQRQKLVWRQLLDAKKGGDLAAIAACFCTPPAVLSDLFTRIWAELAARFGAQLRSR